MLRKLCMCVDCCICVYVCVCARARALLENAYSIFCIQELTRVGPGVRVRVHWYTRTRTRTHNFRFPVMCEADGILKTWGPSPTPDVRTSVPKRCVEHVYGCVRHPLGPTPALPPAFRALCRAPSHSNPWSHCVTSREAQKRGVRRSSSPTKRPAGSLGPGVEPAQTRYYPAPLKGDQSPVMFSVQKLIGTGRPSPGV